MQIRMRKAITYFSDLKSCNLLKPFHYFLSYRKIKITDHNNHQEDDQWSQPLVYLLKSLSTKTQADTSDSSGVLTIRNWRSKELRKSVEKQKNKQTNETKQNKKQKIRRLATSYRTACKSLNTSNIRNNRDISHYLLSNLLCAGAL